MNNSSFKSLSIVTAGLTIGLGLSISQAQSAQASPVNDNVIDALVLDLDTLINFDNTGATAEAGEVSPGSGTGASTCNSQDGWCSFETNVQSSIWYSFVASEDLFVDFYFTGMDSQAALWEVLDPTDFGTFTEVAANDDSGPVFAPYITPVSVTQGSTYYLQVDGYSGAEGTGTFIANSTPVPEPAATLGLLALGLLGTTVLKRKQN
ncbi:PEP-CTERM sorting domain-containing protein [Roseofilum capinflatum]|uniref:PEP-CTERM sorting domain-containing protein n=1 Tax=Roseofilum capinflatum BLCC-M114 TaxID=3022440 RepID=A0ABT7B4E5_9CYAN|nr:PEP-CTERM sorting domain-containing protein [Roseofilum capinflatum]MDJ1174040.1 PEP-CTERM sorting domain-containing protein [Roseofilum capinflatum BLCC-M114]